MRSTREDCSRLTKYIYVIVLKGNQAHTYACTQNFGQITSELSLGRDGGETPTPLPPFGKNPPQYFFNRGGVGAYNFAETGENAVTGQFLEDFSNVPPKIKNLARALNMVRMAHYLNLASGSHK